MEQERQSGLEDVNHSNIEAVSMSMNKAYGKCDVICVLGILLAPHKLLMQQFVHDNIVLLFV